METDEQKMLEYLFGGEPAGLSRVADALELKEVTKPGYGGRAWVLKADPEALEDLSLSPEEVLRATCKAWTGRGWFGRLQFDQGQVKALKMAADPAKRWAGRKDFR